MQTNTQSELACGDVLNEAAVQLTAHHIRQRYPHLFESSNPTSAYRDVDGYKCIVGEPYASDVQSAAASMTASPAASCDLSLSRKSHGSSTWEDTPAGADSRPDSGAAESATSSAARISHGQGSHMSLGVARTGSLRAGQVALQEGLHAAALRDSASPLSQLLLEPDADVADATRKGILCCHLSNCVLLVCGAAICG